MQIATVPQLEPSLPHATPEEKPEKKPNKVVPGVLPEWFHYKGRSIRVSFFLEKPQLEFRSPGVILQIYKHEGRFKATWTKDLPYSGKISGDIQLIESDIPRMFGLEEGDSVELPDSIRTTLGKFYRRSAFLVIPGPCGTIAPGDASVSVFVTQEIQKKVREFLSL